MQKKKQEGITLIALVITIIILLILAGVTISQLSGDNGLFGKVRQAVEKYKNASLDEELMVDELERNIENFTIIKKNEMITAQESDVLEGKTYYDENKTLHTGTKKKKVKLTKVKEDLSSRYEQTVNLKDLKIDGYQNLNTDNFLIVNKGLTRTSPSSSNEMEDKFGGIELTYDPNTGVLKLGKDKSFYHQGGNPSAIYVCYYIYDLYIK